MEGKGMMQETMDLLGSLREDASQAHVELKREVDSLDDFEHLSHESKSPVRDEGKTLLDEDVLMDTAARAEAAAEVASSALTKAIDKRVESASDTAARLADALETRWEPTDIRPSPVVASPVPPPAMDSNLLDFEDAFPDRKEADAKLDKFLNEMALGQEKPAEKLDDMKEATMDFVEKEMQRAFSLEKADLPPPPQTDDILEHYSDSDAEDDFKHEDFHADFQHHEPEQEPEESAKFDQFKDVHDFEAKFDLPNFNLPQEQPLFKTPEPEPLISEQVILPEVPKEEPKIATPVEEKPREVIEEIIQEETPPAPVQVEKVEKPKKNVIEAEAMFCKMGLVESLIYWRDPKKSGPVFGAVLVILLSLKFFSLISVGAYVSLLGLLATISFRIYKNIVQAVQKTGDGHPFKEYLELDVVIPQQKVEEVTKIAVAHMNAALVELRRLFLVEDLVDSIKFAVLLWCCTYLGAWFNGITLIILAWIALFSLPKVYETNKTQIDANLDIVKSKLADITSKVKAAVPIGKKSEEKKE
ncbi:reticulon-1 isoform X2 [Atheta coriaria]|uniref:reticulon-1 isoform X2 n=1 Tax=Dalotia coriaria TaxID=877792 RepID=UPI0031F35A25